MILKITSFAHPKCTVL